MGWETQGLITLLRAFPVTPSHKDIKNLGDGDIKEWLLVFSCEVETLTHFFRQLNIH